MGYTRVCFFHIETCLESCQLTIVAVIGQVEGRPGGQRVRPAVGVGDQTQQLDRPLPEGGQQVPGTRLHTQRRQLRATRSVLQLRATRSVLQLRATRSVLQRQRQSYSFKRQGQSYSFERQAQSYSFERQGQFYSFERQGQSCSLERQGQCYSFERQGQCYSFNCSMEVKCCLVHYIQNHGAHSSYMKQSTADVLCTHNYWSH